MKPYASIADKTCTKQNRPKTNVHAGRSFDVCPTTGTKPDGTVIHDKTQHFKARPGAKDKIRKEKISLKKTGRQRLKRAMLEDVCAEDDK